MELNKNDVLKRFTEIAVKLGVPPEKGAAAAKNCFESMARMAEKLAKQTDRDRRRCRLEVFPRAAPDVALMEWLFSLPASMRDGAIINNVRPYVPLYQDNLINQESKVVMNQTENTVLASETEVASQQQLFEREVRVPVKILSLLIDMANSHVEDIDSGIAEGLYLEQDNLDIESKREAATMADAIYQKTAMGKSEEFGKTSESSTKATKIIVVLEGGLVREVLTAESGISVAVIDYDKEAGRDDGILIPQGNGKTAPAYASIIEPEIIDRTRVAELYDVVDSHICIGDLEESLAEAKKIANAKAEFVLFDPRTNASFSGKFMGVTDHHCVISGGRTAVIIELSNMQMLPDRVGKDEMVDVAFKNCKGTIDVTKSKEVER